MDNLSTVLVASCILIIIKIIHDISNAIAYRYIVPICDSCGRRYSRDDRNSHRLWRHNLCIISD